MKKRITSLLLALLLIMSTVPVSQAASTNKILRKPTITVFQMQEWALAEEADPLFIELAPTFYDVSVKYGVDPAITYAQSAKETNFMHFTGVLDASYKNPCGLKITAGGGDKDPDAHKRFDTWEEGITAMVHHMALYAGHVDFPKKDSPDPRHFESIYGTAPNVEDLGGKWAPSLDYGHDVMRRVWHMQSFPTRPYARLSGDNRYETAVAGSQYLNRLTRNVVIASGDNFADALAASPYADLIDAPILLTGKNVLPQAVKNEIVRLEAGYATLLGGTGSVSDQVVKDLEALGLKVTRLEGINRYETANAIHKAYVAKKTEILEKVGKSYEGLKGAILVSGQEFADALSASGYAARAGYPIFLTDGNTLSKTTLAELKSIGFVLIVGGENAISLSLQETLIKAGVKTVRIAGSNRYKTSALFAEKYYDKADTALVASGVRYQDALVAAPIAAKYGAPILLTDGTNLDADVTARLKTYDLTRLLVMGGESVVSSGVYTKLQAYVK